MSARRNGFTLVELLITLVIMVGVFSVAIPQYSKSMDSMQLRKSTQEIASYLRNARNASITESKTVVLVVDADEHIIRQGDSIPAYQWPANINVEFFESQDIYANSERTIQFRPDGTATARPRGRLPSACAGSRR